MAKDITIKNSDGSVIYYPKTVSDLVYDNENGKTVKEEIDTLDEKLYLSSQSATVTGANTDAIYPLKVKQGVTYFLKPSVNIGNVRLMSNGEQVALISSAEVTATNGYTFTASTNGDAIKAWTHTGANTITITPNTLGDIPTIQNDITNINYSINDLDDMRTKLYGETQIIHTNGLGTDTNYFCHIVKGKTYFIKPSRPFGNLRLYSGNTQVQLISAPEVKTDGITFTATENGDKILAWTAKDSITVTILCTSDYGDIQRLDDKIDSKMQLSGAITQSKNIMPPINSLTPYTDTDTLVPTTVNADGFYRFAIPCEPNTTYTVTKGYHIYGYDKDLKYINTFLKSTTGYVSSYTITTGTECMYIVLAIGIYGQAHRDAFNSDEPYVHPEIKQIEKGTTSTNYEPYVKVYHVNKIDDIDAVFTPSSNWFGKNILVIGDSVTENGTWQKKMATMLGANISTHAKGGIKITQMVDGDGAVTNPIAALNTTDVANKDAIIIMAYNEVDYTLGVSGDMYPSNNTLIGRANYAIKRIYEELEKAGNYSCKVIISSPHCFGLHEWRNEDGYTLGVKLLNSVKTCASDNKIPYIDLLNNSGINKNNWKYYQQSASPANAKYIPSVGSSDNTNKPFTNVSSAPSASSYNGYFITVGTVNSFTTYKSNGSSWVVDSTPYPWHADQLHPNILGYEKIGDYMAKQINIL